MPDGEGEPHHITGGIPDSHWSQSALATSPSSARLLRLPSPRTETHANMPINITIDHLNSLTRSDTDSDDSGEQWPFVPRKTPSVGQNSDGNGERSESNTNYRKPRVEEYAPSDDGDGGKWYDGDDDPEEIPTYHKGSGPRPVRLAHPSCLTRSLDNYGMERLTRCLANGARQCDSWRRRLRHGQCSQ